MEKNCCGRRWNTWQTAKSHSFPTMLPFLIHIRHALTLPNNHLGLYLVSRAARMHNFNTTFFVLQFFPFSCGTLLATWQWITPSKEPFLSCLWFGHFLEPFANWWLRDGSKSRYLKGTVFDTDFFEDHQKALLQAKAIVVRTRQASFARYPDDKPFQHPPR